MESLNICLDFVASDNHLTENTQQGWIELFQENLKQALYIQKGIDSRFISKDTLKQQIKNHFFAENAFIYLPIISKASLLNQAWLKEVLDIVRDIEDAYSPQAICKIIKEPYFSSLMPERLVLHSESKLYVVLPSTGEVLLASQVSMPEHLSQFVAQVVKLAHKLGVQIHTKNLMGKN